MEFKFKARPDDFNLSGDLAVPDYVGLESVNSRGYLGTAGVPHEVEAWGKNQVLQS